MTAAAFAPDRVEFHLGDPFAAFRRLRDHHFQRPAVRADDALAAGLRDHFHGKPHRDAIRAGFRLQSQIIRLGHGRLIQRLKRANKRW